MYVNTEYFLTEHAAIVFEKDAFEVPGYFISITDGNLHINAYLSEDELKDMPGRFEQLTWHVCFSFTPDDVMVFAKTGGLLDTLKKQIEEAL